jgi:cation-transporting P-type ATPase C
VRSLVPGIEVLHSLPGRARIGVAGLEHAPGRKEPLRKALEALGGVKSVELNGFTPNILVHFDPLRLSLEEVLRAVHGEVSDLAAEGPKTTATGRSLTEVSPARKLMEVVGTGLTLAMVALQRGKGFKPSPFGLRRFLTLPALTSMGLVRHVIPHGVGDFLKTGRPNIDTLTTTAVFSALLTGRDTSALTILLLSDIGELLTSYTMERTRLAISEMLSVGEDHVWRLEEEGREEKVALEELKKGDVVVAYLGEKISVDGIVLEGQASVDQASITGEFMPRDVKAGDKVFAGTVVKRGRLVIRAEKVGDETAVARIVHMVEEASHRKAPIQAFADKFAENFVPISFLLAGVVFALTRDIVRTLNMLIIDFSCGVKLSTATALSAAICNSATQGILIKGGNYIELLSDLDTLIIDKTGTITEGRPAVERIVCFGEGTSEKELLTLAAAAERHSTHPLAGAILDEVDARGWEVPHHTEAQTVVARGVSARVNGDSILVGSRRFMEENDIATKEATEHASRMHRMGQSVLYVARRGKLIGLIGVEDTLRDNVKKALNRLRMSGIDDIVLLTGDVEQTAELVAHRLYMDRFQANVLPEDKASVVAQFQDRGTRVVMVGDGVNDAPALAYADVGIALGTRGTDIAIETADIIIQGDDPLKIPSAIKLSQKTMGIIRQNFAAVIGINSMAILLGAMGYITPLIAAVLHNSTTVGVVINSGRMLLHKVK